MDAAHSTHKSSSNGSLHNAYRANAKVANNPHPRTPSQRRPLRIVNENSSLLRGPGPLESMLKTTTETGDISIFSIKASTTAPATYHQPPRSRPNLPDVSLLPQPRSRLYDEIYLHDEQRWAKSHRDTTSEIISLYASDHQPPYLRSVSPVLDNGQRSYSLTTCSSRHIPSQKSSGTLQSQSSSNGLQRPRSPFPYPTRLKRPGVRPASPALGENGGVDYTKMVELDRVSHRTVHGSYKPSYSHSTRRPPPLSLRKDANRATSTLPTRVTPGAGYYGLGSSRARTPSSSHPWAPRQLDRHQGSSTDQSTRSASLTSIVEMYHRPTTSGRSGNALRSAGSFYYDYSEEFDKPPPPVTEAEAPICPIPRRAGSIGKPMVLRDETHACLDSATSETEPEVTPDQLQTGKENSAMSLHAVPFDIQRKHRRNDSAPVMDEGLGNGDSDSNQASTDNGSPFESGRTTLVQKRDETHSAPPINGVQVSSRSAPMTPPKAGLASQNWKSSSTRGAWRLSKTLGAEPNSADFPQLKRASQSSLTRFKCTLDPTLSEFASLFSSFDRLAKSPIFSKRGNEGLLAKDSQSTESGGEEESVCSGKLRRRSSLQLFGGIGLDGKIYRRRHRRNVAAMRISTTGFSHEDPEQMNSHSQDEFTILSPEPISPARQLRVKNSIPQLMKALPPLPQDTGTPEKEGMPSQKFDGPMDGPRQLQLQRKKIHEETSTAPLLAGSTEKCVRGSEESHESPLKFKLRIKTSPGPSAASEAEGSTTSYSSENQAIPKQGPSTASKPRLKLKVSRSQLGQTRLGLDEPIVRNSRLKQCNSLADLAHCPRKGTPTSHNVFDEAFVEDDESKLDSGGSIRESEDENFVCQDPSLQPSDQFNIPYPPSPDKLEGVLPSSASTNKMAPSEMRSFNSDSGPRGHRGLRQKFSVLRLRLGGPQTGETSKPLAATPPVESHEGELPRQMAETPVDGNDEMAGDENEKAVSMRSDRLGGRVKRWASGAKRAVRSYVRRTLDRSSRLSH